MEKLESYDLDRIRECLRSTISLGLKEISLDIQDHSAISCIDKLDDIRENIETLEKLEHPMEEG